MELNHNPFQTIKSPISFVNPTIYHPLRLLPSEGFSEQPRVFFLRDRHCSRLYLKRLLPLPRQLKTINHKWTPLFSQDLQSALTSTTIDPSPVPTLIIIIP